MRLLNFEEDDKLIITLFEDTEIPPYAILSHTWGEDGDEVTFADLAEGDYTYKPGYEKICFCREQTRRDGLLYFWVDTCCIDKNDLAEHSLAIQSMFRWYQNATKCYVYLSDVSVEEATHSSTLDEYPWESVFRSSRWFTRGWTLQELLAPSIVEFFSREWEKLGNRVSLKSLIRKITGIPHDVLDGAPLSWSSVDERLQWKGERETKRDEDAWYSLAGVLDVRIAPAYGEGAASAFQRLMDEIRKLEDCVRDMHHTDPRDDKRRIEDTKGGIIADSFRWILHNTTYLQWQQDQYSQLLWVRGDPGKGKTMLLCGLIDELQSSMPRTTLLSYFFCQASDSRLNSATSVVRGLLYMLMEQQPSLVSHIRKKHSHAGKSLFEDANAWVALTEIFADVLRDRSLRATYLVIDGLDECVTDLPKLLDFLANHASTSPCVKWIVSSRNWPDIEAPLERAEHQRLSLELNADSVAAAVNIFIDQKVEALAKEKRFKPEVQHAVLQHLRTNADDTFLWVALVCQDLKATPKWNILKKLYLFPPGLDPLYGRMLNQISEDDGAETCRQVLASTALLYRPVTISELVALVEELEDLADDPDSVREIIGFCRSFLTLRDDTVYFVHQSAKDFLFAKARAEVFPDGTEDVHRAIFLRSLTTMSTTLHRDMYNLKEWGSNVENVEPPSPDPLRALRYPCIYWIDHLYETELTKWASNANDRLQKEVVEEFLRKKYLYWLEGLSLCNSVEKGIVSMSKLWSLVQERNCQDELHPLVEDTRRFIMYHKGAIESYPLQIYTSALLFSPTGSLVKQVFQYEEPEQLTITPPMSDGWSSCLQTLEDHNSMVRVSCVAFSHDSAMLASASYKTLNIWDAGSGARLQMLKGHEHDISLVTFARDSTRLASVSSDTVKIWDAYSGACIKTLEGHKNVAFSHDLAMMASASYDTIKIWDSSEGGKGACRQVLDDRIGVVSYMTFSHDSTRLATASYATIKIWNRTSGARLLTLSDHHDLVTSMAFSSNSTKLASSSDDQAVIVWDANRGTLLWRFRGHSDRVTSVAFSNSSTILASSSYDRTIKFWDTDSGTYVQTLKGHSDRVNTLSFAPDSTRLASGSHDTTVKIWDAGSSANAEQSTGHNFAVTAIAFSHDSEHLASGSFDRTIKIWEVGSGSGACLHTLAGHTGLVKSLAFSHDSTRLASGSYDRTVRIWDLANSGTCLFSLKSLKEMVTVLAFSPDSELLAAAAYRTVDIWDIQQAGLRLRCLKQESDITSLSFSHDSRRLAVGLWDGSTTVWNTLAEADARGLSTQRCIHILKSDHGKVVHLAFSPRADILAAVSRVAVEKWDTDNEACRDTIQFWDLGTAQCMRTIDTGRMLGSVRFDDTGVWLHTSVGRFSFGAEHVVDLDSEIFSPISLRAGGTWINYKGRNRLWIPSEYRPLYWCVSGRVVAVGDAIGRVWWCRFRDE